MRIKTTSPAPSDGPQGLLTKGEKLRIGFMALLLVGVSIALWTSMRQQDQASDIQQLEVEPAAAPVIVRTAVPDIDRELLKEAVQDATETGRAVVAAKAFESLFDSARRFAPEHFNGPETTELDAATTAELMADAEAQRGSRYRARGWVRRWRERGGLGPDDPRRYEGELELEDGTTAFFVAAQAPDKVLVDDTYLRVDGLFLQRHRQERDGSWYEGPLLVAPRAIKSFRSLGKVEQLDTLALLQNVQDDSIAGMHGVPFHELWQMMAYARDVPEGSVDWDSVPEFSNEILSRLAEDGAAFRGEPMRIPISVMMGVTVLRAPENPARIEEYSQGWIANQQWSRPFQFRAPFPISNLERNELLTARGFFFKNLAYESKDKGLQVAPVFVLSHVEQHIVPQDNSIKQLFWIVAFIVVGLTSLIFLLLIRDNRRSKELQEALIRRRRARRARTQQA